MLKTIALFLALSLPAMAAPASKESVETLLAVTQSKQMLEAMMSNIEASIRQGINSSNEGKTLTPAQQQVFDNMAVKISKLLQEELSWEQMKSLYTQIYQESFTEEEINGLIAFYQSPAGVAFVNKMPAVLQKSMQLTQSRMGPMAKKLEKITEDARKEAEQLQ